MNLEARMRARLDPAANMALRKKAGISRAELAEAVGVSMCTLWRWEQGDRIPNGRHAEIYGELLTRLETVTHDR